MRRTTTIDATRPDGLEGGIVADVRGQDVRTDATGRGEVVDRLDVRVEIDPDLLSGRILAVTENAASRPLDGLVGLPSRGGFGRRLAELLADEAQRRSLLYSVLEDLSAAVLVSGYALLHGGAITESHGTAEQRAAHQADICIGWATGSPLVESLRHTGITALPIGPPAPADESDDPLGWHAMAPMGTYTVRRRRRLDVTTSPSLRSQSHFRDSCATPDGPELVMHEYLVDTGVDAEGRLARVDVEPRVLPWYECPGAVASAQGIVGVAVADIPTMVRRELVGPRTCTHLSSTLRGLADIRHLAGLLENI